MRSLLLLTFLFFSQWQLHGQSELRPANSVAAAKEQGSPFKSVQLFAQSANRTAIPEVNMSEYDLLTLNAAALNQLRTNRPAKLLFRFPSTTRLGQMVEIELVEVDLFAYDFEVILSSTNAPAAVDRGLHYRGIIKGENQSIAALSFFDNDVMGLISHPELGNYVLGKLQGRQADAPYIFYPDQQILQTLGISCDTPDDDHEYGRKELMDLPPGRALSDCVGLYFEVDNDIFNNKGGTQGTTNYVTGIFNQVSTLYANESINTVISQLFLWSTASPYSSSSSSGMLSQFQSFRTSWPGDLAQLLSYKASGGIAAGFNGICNSNRAASMSFSSINSTFAVVPTYSWTIEVVTHEFGHLFGSRHTHACVWNGNNTAIDGCAGSTEGSCPVPGNPAGGGTIMSYCHLTSVGINLSLGFGTQPGNVIRNVITNATCLAPCGPPTCDDGFQNGNETGVDCGGPNCPACPTCTDGIQNGSEVGVDCGGTNCPSCPCNNNLTLTIKLDNYPEETTWQITDANGGIWDSGGPYGNQPDGSTVNEPICLPNGCYTLSLYDSFGDGICCGFGNGFFTLTNNATGAVLASGGQFDDAVSIGFCVSSIVPPPATCTDGIQNGNETGVDCGGPDCLPCTSCNDGLQNGDETGVDCGGSCAPCAGCNLVVISDGFEGTFGNWASGGVDCNLTPAFANTGSYAVYIRDNTSTSTLTSNALPSVAAYQELKVNFSFIARNFDNNTQDFWLQISQDGGATFSTIKAWVYTQDFNNLQRQNPEVIIPGPFTSATRLRFRCDATDDNDLVYLDDIVVTGCIGENGPTCTDGVQNGGETGVDCGGPFCPPCDTCNDGIQNGGETGVDCGGGVCPPCTFCNDGIQNGDETGVDCGGAFCPACPSCDDGIQNGNETGVDCGGPDCAPCSTMGTCLDSEFSVYNFNNFEAGLGIWNCNEDDCRSSPFDQAFAYSGTYCVRLKDDSPTSVLTTNGLDLSAYTELKVTFTYFIRGFENTESFVLEYSTNGGASFQVAEDWVLGTDFSNFIREDAEAVILGPFSSNTQIRFRNIASDDSDLLYLDDVAILGCTGSALPGLSSYTAANLNELRLFPNPAKGELTLRYHVANSENVHVSVTNLMGERVFFRNLDEVKGTQQIQLNVADWAAGIYFVHLEGKDFRLSEKLIVGQ
ncbi:MAG TPA: zinc-dependent metalloprotease [Saprospiraceae bacterium]|nr:zinc-dependent metalloprotease [Saprospiraceae bacterium]HMQ82001.1 zinc-dependent metalloprotease [Saprospiraceae bacterium]